MSDILLLSGGIDSSALAAWLRPNLCLTINYGQRAATAEIHAAKAICEALDLHHESLDLPIAQLGCGDMSLSQACRHSQNSEFWPFRNQFLITVAAMRAIQYDAQGILIGSVRTDFRHADGRKEFIEGLNNLLQSQEGGLKLSAPAIDMTTLKLIQRSRVPMEILAWAHSCHISNLACGNCKGCNKHSEIMTALGFIR